MAKDVDGTSHGLDSLLVACFARGRWDFQATEVKRFWCNKGRSGSLGVRFCWLCGGVDLLLLPSNAPSWTEFQRNDLSICEA